MKIKKTKSKTKIEYTLCQVPGKIGNFILTKGTRLDNHLFTSGIEFTNECFFEEKVLGIYDLAPDTNIDEIVFSDFKRYVEKRFSDREYCKRRFSEIAEEFKL